MDNQEILGRKILTKRDLVVDHDFLKKTGKIAAIVGPRRAGKSCYLLQVREELKIPQERTIWVDFSSGILDTFSPEDWEKLWSVAIELTREETPLFLLDEVQECENFEKGLRYLQNQGARLYLTGSNATVFEKELASRLRGKVINYHLFPLSFVEFLRFKGDDAAMPVTTRAKSMRRRLLKEFLEWGGFPEVVLADREELKAHLLSSYLDIMLLRDVIERHSVNNISLLQRLLSKALRSYTKEFSVHKCYQDFRSQGIEVSKDSLYKYLRFLKETYFFFELAHFDPKSTSSKIFLTDSALARHLSNSPDIGKCFENLVFVDLLRKGDKPKYWKGPEGEIDFVTQKSLIQVTIELSEGNKKREEAALQSSAFKDSKLERRIITLDSYVGG